MKKLIIFLLLIIFLGLLCSCEEESTSTVTEMVTERVTVDYVSGEGGSISGIASQSLQKGEKTSEVKAVADTGYVFDSWDDDNKNSERSDVAQSDKTYKAIFKKAQFEIKYTAGEGGEILGQATQIIEYGSSATRVEAVPGEGYIFLRWSDGDENPQRTDENISEGKDIQAIFGKSIIDIKYLSTEGGSISGETTQTINAGDTTTEVTAIPESGYYFECWDDGYKEATRHDTSREEKEYTAIFRRYAIITIKCAEGGTVVGEKKQTVRIGEKISMVKAIPDEGYTFHRWSNWETGEELEFVVEKSCTVTAYFKRGQSDFPAIYIDLDYDRKEIHKYFYKDCVITVSSPNEEYSFENYTARIKGRGNTSWGAYKKPYKIKFDQKVDLFGNGKAKDWVLLANHYDQSMVRQYLALKTAELFDSLYASSTAEFADVFINGEYLGVYLICEQIEENKNRCDIDQDTTKVDTGYILELDMRGDRVYKFVSYNQCYLIHFPDDDDPNYTDAHTEFIKSYMDDCMSAVLDKDYERVCSLIDVYSFADAYIIYEMTNCLDVGCTSFYMYKDAGGKLICGPLWDFDRSVGSGDDKDGKPYTRLWAKETNNWFNKMLEIDEFKALVTSEIHLYEQRIRDLIDEEYVFIEQYATSFKRNFEKWSMRPIVLSPSTSSRYYTWEEQINYVKDYLNKSLTYLCDNIYPE